MPTTTSTDNKGCVKLGSARANSSTGLFVVCISPIDTFIRIDKNSQHVMVDLACDRWTVVCHSGTAWIMDY